VKNRDKQTEGEVVTLATANITNVPPSVSAIVDAVVPIIRALVPIYSSVNRATEICKGVGTEFVVQFNDAHYDCGLDLTNIYKGTADFALSVVCDGFNVAEIDREWLMKELKRRFGGFNVSTSHIGPNPDNELQFSVQVSAIF
jgi:hypothetical protein